MKQVFIKKGQILVEDVPAPIKKPNAILVEVVSSLISTGTELSMVQASQETSGRVTKVLDSIKVRGVRKTVDLIQEKLDGLTPLGYSCVGTVLAVGDRVTSFQVGDRVACAGAGWANHAEIVSVPEKLAVLVPTKVSDRSASFVTLGAIALQGVRRADAKLGETVCVIGLGLVGQLVAQLLSASGCRVYGVDPDASRIALAKENGMIDGWVSSEEAKKRLFQATGNHGVDVTMIAASTTSHEPVNAAFELTRKKGRIVVVGAVGMDLKRSPFYEREQDFLISCSYGPGRYDDSYEMSSNDYPYAYVRWTENRNMTAFLDLLSLGKIRVESLIGADVPVAEASNAYSLLSSTKLKPLSILLTYLTGKSQREANVISFSSTPAAAGSGKIRLVLVGASEFVRSMHIPNIKRLSDQLIIHGVCSSRAAVATALGKHLKVLLVTSSFEAVLEDPDVDAVLIATRHHQHAKMTEAALRAGKHVFVEKPLALSISEIDSLEKTIKQLPKVPVLMVGYNRRFSPFLKRIKDTLASRTSPLLAVYRVNAGSLPEGHWVNSEEGGGRLRGEACHMIDAFSYLVGQPLRHASIESLKKNTASRVRPDENFSANFTYEDGSLCQLVYTSMGHSQLPKEWLELHWDGQSAVLDDYSKVILYGTRVKEYSATQDKGHSALLTDFIESIRKGVSFPIPWDELKATTQATAELNDSLWGTLL